MATERNIYRDGDDIPGILRPDGVPTTDDIGTPIVPAIPNPPDTPTAPFINVKQITTVTTGGLPPIALNEQEGETVVPANDVPVVPVLGVAPTIRLRSPVFNSDTRRISIKTNTSGQFSVLANRTSNVGTVVFSAVLVNSSSPSISIGSPVISDLGNGSVLATFQLQSTGENTGNFRIEVRASTQGVDNEPLDSNTISVYGNVFAENTADVPSVTVIPLRTVLNIPINRFELPEDGITTIDAFTTKTDTILSHEILDATLVINDPLASPFLDNRFKATRNPVANVYSFNVTSQDFREKQAAVTGVLTVRGKTNTNEIQIVTEEFIFYPIRNIINHIKKLDGVVEIDNGARANVNLFEIMSDNIIVESADVSYDSDQIQFLDYIRDGRFIQFPVYNITGFRPVGFKGTIGVRFTDSEAITYIENNGSVLTPIEEPVIVVEGTPWPDPSVSYISIDDSVITIDESRGETFKSKRIANGSSLELFSIEALPNSVPVGMDISVSVVNNGIVFNAEVTNFEAARGEHIIPIRAILTLQKNGVQATKQETINIILQVLKRDTVPAVSGRTILFNVTPTFTHSISNLVEIQQIDVSGNVIQQFFINNGQYNKGFLDGDIVRIIPSQTKRVDGSLVELVSVTGVSPRETENDVYRTFEPTVVDGRTVYEFTVHPGITDRITIEYTVDNIAPSINAEFQPYDVKIRNGQTPAAVPILNATFTHTDRIQLTAAGGVGIFNEGQPLSFSVPYSPEPQNIQEFFSWDMFDKGLGLHGVVITASNLKGKTTQSTIYVSFEAVTEPPVTTDTGGVDTEGGTGGYDTYNFITDVLIDKPAIEKNHTLTVEYSIRNIGRLLLDDGTGNERLADVLIGLESQTGEVISISRNVPTLKRRRITIDAPTGTYKVFAEIEGRTFPLSPNDTSGNPSDTRLYANTFLTILAPAAPEPPPALTVDDIITALIPVVNDQISIEKSFTDLINDRKILRNLLVSEDSKREYLILNYIKDVDDSVILKLYDPLGQQEQSKGKFYIAYELIDPFVTTVELNQNVVSTQLSLRGPNFNVKKQTDLGLPVGNINLIDTSDDGSTGLLRYDELINFKTESDLLSISDTDLDGTGYVLSGSITTDILNDILGGRLINDDELGIDYTNYSNFVFYSSAEERLTNFKYKIGLIESHESSRNLINSSSASSSIAVRNEINYYNVEINQITSTFDGYEKFLFYTTGSASWPKINGRIEPSTASLSVAYYTSQSLVAELFDSENQYNLHKDIPEHIRRDNANTDFLLFISMLGHHFDLIKVHIDAVNRLFVRSHDVNIGTPTKLVNKLLESFGWQIRTRGAQEDLINYLLGKQQNGSARSTTTGKSRNEELHRRFLNNLPYIYKAKGTRASIRALFNMYGIPSSIIRIQEFGGPKLTSDTIRYYTFDDQTQLLNMSGSEQVSLDFVSSNLNRKPDTIEITFRTNTKPAGHGPNTSGSYQLITLEDASNQYVTLNVDSVPGSDFNGKLRLVISGSTGNSFVTSSKFPIFDNDLYTVGLIRNRVGASDSVDLYAKRAIYELFTHENSASLTVANSMWESASFARIGNDFYGSVSEFRIWKRPISETAFDRHVLYNESISGDNYTSSMYDMLVRIPFERPQELSSNTTLINFAWTGSSQYPVAAATASNFTAVANDPYQFEYIEVDSATEIPSIGYRAETDKIRFESQSLLDTAELNVSARITKKQFDQAPIDSNKLGIFVSPTDEVNRDIVRSFGGLDFMNEIGNPADYYSSSYTSLDAINEHYWSRHTTGMNIYDYITLVRQFDKTVFDYIDDVKPARVKVVKGLLIEPHMLERNKVQHRKPSKENLFWDGTLDASNTGSFTSNYPTYESNNVNTNSNIISTGSYPTYTDTIDLTDDVIASAESLYWTGSVASTFTSANLTGSGYPTYDATVRANVTHSITIDYEETSKLSVIGFEENFKIPKSLSPTFPGGGYGEPQSAFGLFAKNGYADIIFVKEGITKYRRFKVELVELPVSRSVSQLTNGATRGQEGTYATVVVPGTETALNILNVSASFTAGSTRINGYLPFHRIYTSDLTLGLQNSFYNGSKTTGGSFVDDSKAVETFISKPGVLKVNKKGDSESEPILEIE